MPVLLHGVSQRIPPRSWAAENLQFAMAVIVEPLDAPLAVPRSSKTLAGSDISVTPPHTTANAAPASPAHATHRAVDKLVDIAFPLPGDRGTALPITSVRQKNRQFL
jgi:hypothetical protein